MTEENDPITRFLTDLEGEAPPADLRARSLERALQVWTESAASDRWRRLWESAPLRLAWAASVVVLVAAHLVVPLRSGRATTSVTAAGRQADTELQEVVRLPRLRASYVGVDAARELHNTNPNAAPTQTRHPKESRS